MTHTSGLHMEFKSKDKDAVQYLIYYSTACQLSLGKKTEASWYTSSRQANDRTPSQHHQLSGCQPQPCLQDSAIQWWGEDFKRPTGPAWLERDFRY